MSKYHQLDFTKRATLTAIGLVTGAGAMLFKNKPAKAQTFTQPSYTTFSSTQAGLVPASGGSSTSLFLTQAGTFATAGGSIGPGQNTVSYFTSNAPTSSGLRSGVTDSTVALSGTLLGTSISNLTGGASGTSAHFVPIYSDYAGGTLEWLIG